MIKLPFTFTNILDDKEITIDLYDVILLVPILSTNPFSTNETKTLKQFYEIFLNQLLIDYKEQMDY